MGAILDQLWWTVTGSSPVEVALDSVIAHLKRQARAWHTHVHEAADWPVHDTSNPEFWTEANQAALKRHGHAG